MRLGDLVPASGIRLRLSSTEREGAIGELAELLAAQVDLSADLVRAALIEREQLGSTALGHGVAVPHAKLAVARTVGVLGLSEGGIPFDSPDGEPVHIFVAFISPVQGGRHLLALAAVGQELSDAEARRRLLAAKCAEDVHALLDAVPAR